MSQPITPELKDWLLSQQAKAYSNQALLEAMLSSGWQRTTALAALDQVLGWRPPVQQKPCPEIGHSAGANHLDLGDRVVPVLLTITLPKVVVLGGFLSDDECDALIGQAQPRLSRSLTVSATNDGQMVNDARTSKGMFFERGESPLIRRIENRLAKLCNWPIDHGEGLQVLHYAPGDEYRPHYDYFNPETGSAALKQGGQRVATVVMYLNQPDAGGGTVFPDIGLEVMPAKGHAVFFSYPEPTPQSKTLHGGAPVIAGEKWVATKWMRQAVF